MNVDFQIIPNPFVAPFRPRHLTVQRWYEPVLKHLGEDVRGDAAVWAVGKTLFCHPSVFREMLVNQLTGLNRFTINPIGG